MTSQFFVLQNLKQGCRGVREWLSLRHPGSGFRRGPSTVTNLNRSVDVADGEGVANVAQPARRRRLQRRKIQVSFFFLGHFSQLIFPVLEESLRSAARGSAWECEKGGGGEVWVKVSCSLVRASACANTHSLGHAETGPDAFKVV